MCKKLKTYLPPVLNSSTVHTNTTKIPATTCNTTPRFLLPIPPQPTTSHYPSLLTPSKPWTPRDINSTNSRLAESKSKVRQSRAKAVVAKVNSISSTPAISSDVAELKDMVRALLLEKKNQSSAPAPSPTPAPVKAVEPNCVTCGEDLKGITTRSGVAYQGPTIPVTSKVVKQGTEVTKDQVQTPSSQSTAPVQPPVAKSETPVSKPVVAPIVKQGTEVTKDQVQTPSSQSTAPVQPPVAKSETPVSKPVVAPIVKQGTEPVVAPVSAPMLNLKPSIPYPSRCDNERRRDQANEQIEKFYEIFKDMSFEISFTDALILMPKFASTLKALIGNKDKLSEMARTLMNEHCSAVILNKLPKKLGDPDKFLIPCEFLGMDECLALADLGASINLMPLYVWEELSLPELTLTCMTLELADRSVSKSIGIAKDVKVKVGMFHFPADFVVVDFEPDPRVPLILERCFLKIGRALIDVYKGELTLCIGNEAITYNLDQTSRYSANYDQMTANKIDVTDEAYEEYSQEVLGFSNVTAKDDPDSPKFDPSYYDPEGDILLLEAILNSEPSPPLPNHEKYVSSFKNELKACEAKTIKSSIDEPPEVELKDLPPHLEYVFLEGNNNFPVIIAKELGDEEKSALIKVLKSHKRAIAWKLSDIQEVEKLLDAGLIYPISDSPWVSPVHCVPKKGSFTIVKNEENELIPTHLVTGWRRQRSPAHMGRLPIAACLSVYAMRRARFKGTMEVFMDDFSIFGNSFENCLSRLDKMMQRCEDTKLCLNWEKSHFMVKEGIVLGHKISKNGIEVDKAKVDVITKLPHPTTVKGVQSFLGHAGFYRRFSKDFSKISRPMTHLLEKDTPFIFFEDCIKAFQTLKKKLTKAPILIAPNWDLPFELMCDTSDFAIGAVLGQRYEKHFRPIHYASKTLTEAESNYTTTEKGMLVVVYAFEKFQSYLIMNKCIVHTDHSALKYLFAKKDAKARLLRCVMLLQEFDFDVLDTKGAENLAADHLS
nr:reverse transcriptase domain-containing protein [Tanacetum cinerariifolium]